MKISDLCKRNLKDKQFFDWKKKKRKKSWQENIHQVSKKISTSKFEKKNFK